MDFGPFQMNLKGIFFGISSRLFDEISHKARPNILNHTSNIAHRDIVKVGIKRPKRMSL